MSRWFLLLAGYGVIAVACQFGWLGNHWAMQMDQWENLSPNQTTWLGTDHLGRDVLASLFQGCRMAVGIGSIAAIISLSLGTFAGLAAGWYGRRADQILVWLAGATTAIPGLLLALTLAFALGAGFWTLCLAIGFSSWVAVFRLVRVEVRRIRLEDYVGAAHAWGATWSHLWSKHLLPQLAPLLKVQFGLLFIFAVKAEVILSFLGVGLIDQPSWGQMIADAWAWNDLGAGRWWRLTGATCAMAGLVLAVQQLCEGTAHRKQAAR